MTKAHLSWGRWCVDCECGSAMWLKKMEADIRCLECGVLIRVEYPPNVEAIEGILAGRPVRKLGSKMVPTHANWHPGESLASMRRENRDHDIS